ETRQYSERVVGLGIWNPPKLNWLRSVSNQWLPEHFPIDLGGRTVELTPETFGELRTRVNDAIEAGHPTVGVEGRQHVAEEVVEAPEAVRPLLEQPDTTLSEEISTDDQQPAGEKSVLIVSDNIEEVGFVAGRRKRPAHVECGLPVDQLGATEAKPHQLEGFHWLVDAWTSGWPGVLLADDMGLGKTFQALVFLAWLRKNWTAQEAGRGGVKPGPMLIVAPTALLRNWVAEAELHLAPDALGQRVDCYGSSLKQLK